MPTPLSPFNPTQTYLQLRMFLRELTPSESKNNLNGQIAKFSPSPHSIWLFFAFCQAQPRPPAQCDIFFLKRFFPIIVSNLTHLNFGYEVALISSNTPTFTPGLHFHSLVSKFFHDHVVLQSMESFMLKNVMKKLDKKVLLPSTVQAQERLSWLYSQLINPPQPTQESFFSAPTN